MKASMNLSPLKRKERLEAELEVMNQRLGHFKAKANTQDLLNWTAVIPGPKGSIMEGYEFEVSLVLPHEYPFKPPTCKFVPPIFHMNVYESGLVAHSLLNNAQIEGNENAGWNSEITIELVLKTLQNLLVEPNPDKPANTAAYCMYVEGKKVYEQKIQETLSKMR